MLVDGRAGWLAATAARGQHDRARPEEERPPVQRQACDHRKRTYRRTMPVGSQLSIVVNGRTVTVADDGASLLEVLRDRARHHVDEGRVQPAGAVRVLHRARRRRAAGRVRDTGTPRRGPVDHDTGRHGRTGAAVGGRVLRAPARASAASARPASSCASTRCASAGQGSTTSTRSSARSWRTCAGAPAGAPSSTRGAPTSAEATREVTRDLERASARALARGRLGTAGRSRRGARRRTASPTTPRRRTRWSRCQTAAGAGLWPRRSWRRGAARRKVQGRRTTVDVGHPVALPDGDWSVTLQTQWVEPAYLETDASWCLPGESRRRRWPTVVRSAARSTRT